MEKEKIKLDLYYKGKKIDNQIDIFINKRMTELWSLATMVGTVSAITNQSFTMASSAISCATLAFAYGYGVWGGKKVEKESDKTIDNENQDLIIDSIQKSLEIFCDVNMFKSMAWTGMAVTKVISFANQPNFFDGVLVAGATVNAIDNACKAIKNKKLSKKIKGI